MTTISFFSTQPYDKFFFEKACANHYMQLHFIENALNEQTATLVQNSPVVCVFVNDIINEAVVKILAEKGVKIIALRCAGFNNVAIDACKQYGIKVCRVPAYSPESVAEHAIAMMLTLNRKTHKAYNRVREQNFSLNGLLGFNMHGKTVGVIGTGNIGIAVCKILIGFGCQVVAFDVVANKNVEALGVHYVPLIDLLQQSDIVTLHCPLTEQTKYLINEQTLQYMKQGAMLINTSRGALVNTKQIIKALKTGKIGSVGIDVYEQEANLFFKDLSDDIITDDTIQRLMSFPNVLVTAHQAFFFFVALEQIATTTVLNVNSLLLDGMIENKAALVV